MQTEIVPVARSQPLEAATRSAVEPSESIDSRELRRVLGAFVTGVTVITTIDENGRAYGLTANSFSSVSLNPPLILWNQSLTAPSYPVFRDAKRFAVNILAEDQIDISQRFARAGQDKFAGISIRSGLGGIPLIEGCAAYLECSSEASFPGGDHAVFLGRVEKIEHRARKSLVFGGGKYLSAQPHELGENSPDLAVASQAHLHAVRIATPVLLELARDLNETFALAVWGSYGPTVIRWEQPRNLMGANLRTGVVSQLLTSATGLAFAAYMPEETTAGLIEAELTAASGNPKEGAPVSREALNAVIAEVRAHRLARVVASPNFTPTYGTQINAMCAPVFDMQGRMVLGLTVVGRADTLDVGWDAPVPRSLKAAADALSQRLGHQG